MKNKIKKVFISWSWKWMNKNDFFKYKKYEKIEKYFIDFNTILLLLLDTLYYTLLNII